MTLGVLIALVGGNLSPAGAHDEEGQLRDAERVVCSSPEDRAARVWLAELYRSGGHFREARRELAVLGASGFSDEVRFALSAYYLDVGAPDSALAILDAPVSGVPPSAAAWGLRGDALEALGDLGGALEAYDRRLALERAPGPGLHLQRACLALRLGPAGVSEALNGLRAARERLGPVASLECRAAELEVESGNVDAALSRLDGVRNQLGNIGWLARRADLFARAGRSLEAQATYTEALEAISAVPLRRRTPALALLEEQARAALRAPQSPGIRAKRR